jgi:hypothetical protein
MDWRERIMHRPGGLPRRDRLCGRAVAGTDDRHIHELRQDEQRTLVTLDMDFANLQAYDPKSSSRVILLGLARQDNPAGAGSGGAHPAGAQTRAAGEAALHR